MPNERPKDIEIIHSETQLAAGHCLVCNTSLADAGGCCLECKTPYHGECFSYTNHCSVFGCTGTTLEEIASVQRADGPPPVAPVVPHIYGGSREQDARTEDAPRRSRWLTFTLAGVACALLAVFGYQQMQQSVARSAPLKTSRSSSLAVPHAPHREEFAQPHAHSREELPAPQILPPLESIVALDSEPVHAMVREPPRPQPAHALPYAQGRIALYDQGYYPNHVQILKREQGTDDEELLRIANGGVRKMQLHKETVVLLHDDEIKTFNLASGTHRRLCSISQPEFWGYINNRFDIKNVTIMNDRLVFCNGPQLWFSIGLDGAELRREYQYPPEHQTQSILEGFAQSKGKIAIIDPMEYWGCNKQEHNATNIANLSPGAYYKIRVFNTQDVQDSSRWTSFHLHESIPPQRILWSQNGQELILLYHGDLKPHKDPVLKFSPTRYVKSFNVETEGTRYLDLSRIPSELLSDSQQYRIGQYTLQRTPYHGDRINVWIQQGSSAVRLPAVLVSSVAAWQPQAVNAK